VRFLALLCLVATLAQAQGPAIFVSGGGGAGSSSTAGQATTAALQFYVDPTGSNSNACTATGAAACLTYQGAVDKAPKNIRHLVTVSGAAGTYATGLRLSGFTIDNSFSSTAGLIVEGPSTFVDVTPTTGSATGTATAGTAGSGVTFGTLTDSAATWTVNDFRGKFIVITGGTGSGQVKQITANTATVITIAGTWTAPTTSSTYAIRSPAATITGLAAAITSPTGGTSVAAAGIQIVNNQAFGALVSTGGAITIRNLGVAVAGSPMVASGPGSVMVFQSSLVGTSGIAFTSVIGATVYVNASAVINAGAGSILVNHFGNLGLINSYAQSVGNGGALTVSGGSRATVTSTQFSVSGGSSAGVSASTGGYVTTSNIRCDCASAATSACVISGTPSVTVGAQFASINSGSTDVTNCTSGVVANAGSNVMFSQTSVCSGNSLTYSASAANGGAVTLPSAITITSGTADLSIDNASATAPYSALGAIYGCLASLNTGSRICRL
jgi:hypothetical protein